MNLKNVLICIISMLFFCSCDKDDVPREEVLTLKISAETIELPIVPSKIPTKHMIVTEVKSNDTIYIPFGGIANFQYIEKHAYVVLVKKTYLKEQVQDSDNIDYTLLEIISKDENLN